MSAPRTDSRELPRFTPAEAAAALRIPVSTLRTWIRSRTYPGRTGPRFTKSIIPLVSENPPRLSFNNLAEAHVLSALYHRHSLRTRKIRAAVEWLRTQYPGEHPLLSREFYTNGVDLFVKQLIGHQLRSVNASLGGQLALDAILAEFLQRLERDESGKPVKIFPAPTGAASPKIISITSNVSAGRPIIDRAGISVEAVAKRYLAGETVAELAADYGLTEEEIRAALDYARPLATAA